MANDRKGSSGNLGDLAVSIVTAGRRYRLTNSRLIHGSASGAGGDEQGTQRWYCQAKETKCGEMDGRESQPHSSVEAGERPSRTPWSEGGAALWAGSWNHAEDTVPDQRVTAKHDSIV